MAILLRIYLNIFLSFNWNIRKCTEIMNCTVMNCTASHDMLRPNVHKHKMYLMDYNHSYLDILYFFLGSTIGDEERLVSGGS